MRTTRSSSSINAATTSKKSEPPTNLTTTPSTLGKRKADTKLTKDAKKLAKQEVQVAPVADSKQHQSASNITLVPAVLTFDFQEAKRHLIQADHRFEDLFQRMTCKPFEHLEQAHPFRALVTSILGQQISWLAARSITHKFIRLFDPSLPEKPDDEQRRLITSFPTPEQVATADAATLRTAGLSARKVDYVQDLSARFADGRLSTQKLLEANDDELAQMLIEVRGIGRVTSVDMFAIFSLRRPDILPVGDLGVQRGLLRWFLHLHSPSHTFSISPQKVGGSSSKKAKSKNIIASDELPTVNTPDEEIGETGTSALPTEVEGPNSLPPTFTPSIKKTLDSPGVQPVPLPSAIDLPLLKSRLSGKKIKGAFLTPKEMADLTEHWKPYRSIGIYYMWSLAEAE
ncbi:DNA glycosylase [Phlegmacium glaucopus]|nr:DNA glycosylase [Phlegmacium glaucopus]